VLIHCAAGKDRTGMLAALTHHLLGVSRDDLLADYLLTNTAVDLEARAPGIARAAAEIRPAASPPRRRRRLPGRRARLSGNRLRGIVDRHGSLDAYLEQALGVDAARATGSASG
jgi:protein-tyrosine phosphatase